MTRFTMSVFPQSKIFPGYYFYYAKEKDRLLQAFHEFSKPETYDRRSNCIVSLAYAMGSIIHVGTLQYMRPGEKPPALQRFTSPKHFWKKAKIGTMCDATSQINGFTPGDQRWLWHTTTFENNLDMLYYCYDRFKDTFSAINGVKGLGWSFVFQPLTPFATAKSDMNAMRVRSDKTLTIAQISVSWKRAGDDAVVIKTAEELIGHMEQEAKRRGVHHPYKYVNYCSASQNPYDGYGADKRQLLREASRKYDPQQVFQKGIIGCFKL